MQAVEQLGVDKAVPSRILELMGIDCLTRHNIASHLQVHTLITTHLYMYIYILFIFFAFSLRSMQSERYIQITEKGFLQREN